MTVPLLSLVQEEATMCLHWVLTLTVHTAIWVPCVATPSQPGSQEKYDLGLSTTGEACGPRGSLYPCLRELAQQERMPKSAPTQDEAQSFQVARWSLLA